MKQRFLGGMILLATLNSTPLFAAMEIGDFQAKAGNNTSRCVGGRPLDWCVGELDYARGKDLITQASYDWGKSNEYYPVVSRHDVIEAVCKCGCFEQNTNILLNDPDSGETAYVKAKDITVKHRALALDQDSTLASVHLEDLPIKDLLSGPEEPALYVFQLGNGKVLKLTQHHGTVLADGRVVAAKDVKVGDAMIAAKTGDKVPVIAIGREVTTGKVYNFKVASQDKLNHIVVAEDVLVGDLSWQNALSTELGQVEIRQ